MLQKLYETLENHKKIVIPKETVLVLGSNGSGVSATIAYLLGNSMSYHNDDATGDSYIDTVVHSQNIPKIGDQLLTTCTTYPAFFVNHNLAEHYYCDHPAVIPTASKEQKFLSAVKSYLVMQQLASIKSIIIVISEKNLCIECGRAASFIELLDTVGFILEKISSNNNLLISFVFTQFKQEELLTDDLQLQKKQQMIKKIRNITSNLIKRTDDSKYFRIKSAISLFLSSDENIFVINPLDNGKSRDKILCAIHRSCTIPAKSLQLICDYETKEYINQYLNEIANRAIETFNEILNSLPEKIKQEENSAKQLELELQKIQNINKSSTIYSSQLNSCREKLSKDLAQSKNSIENYKQQRSSLCKECKSENSQMQFNVLLKLTDLVEDYNLVRLFKHSYEQFNQTFLSSSCNSGKVQTTSTFMSAARPQPMITNMYNTTLQPPRQNTSTLGQCLVESTSFDSWPPNNLVESSISQSLINSHSSKARLTNR